MSEELSVCCVTNYYENGKLTGFSVSGEEMISLAEEKPLEVPELFPKTQQIKDKEDALRGAVRFPDEND